MFPVLLKDINELKNIKRNKWNKIIIHHTGGAKVGKIQEINKIIDVWHRTKVIWFWQGKKMQGWKYGMGYHIFIERNGKIYLSERWIKQLSGGHTLGQNRVGIGICCSGNLDLQELEQKQIFVLKKLIIELKLPVFFHKEFQNKNCPGKNFPYKLFRG